MLTSQISYAGPCVDHALQNVKSKQDMKDGGWNVDGLTRLVGWPPKDTKGTPYKRDKNCRELSSAYVRRLVSLNHISFIEATFKGSGKGTLNFGNCFSDGIVQVHLNGVSIGSAYPNKKSEVVSFKYKKGDVLRVSRHTVGIIAINSLKLDCNKHGKNIFPRILLEKYELT